ncbi:MAG: hypothetical protein C4548_09190 [Desulfobacteraceae bacterium]|jgi:hypothetical protein|nr:MAG: hypothetical protein C4548_09190 [Desulfobacteraceae bacterium]
MTKPDSRPGLPVGFQRRPDHNPAATAGKNTALADILQTREVRQALSGILPDLLNALAADGTFGKFIMKLAGNYLTRQLSRPRDIFKEKELAKLFNDSQFIKNLGEPLPDLINSFFDMIAAMAKTVAEMPGAEKKQVFSDIIAKISVGHTGGIITQACRIINDIHKEDPEFFARALEPGFKKWVESVDFGEIREMVDNFSTDGRALITMVNNVLWQYPSKVVLLLSLLPSLVNFLTEAIDISAGKLNELPPDMLTDVILSFARDINTGSVAGVINQITEITRKIYTGSALLGEPGAPQLPKVASDMMEAIIGQTDPSTLWKAKIALAEIGAAMGQAVAAAVNSRPEFKQLNMTMGPKLTNIRLRSLNQKLFAWESVDDAEMAESYSRRLEAYDVQEMAEIVNNALRIINRLGDEKPALFTEFAGQMASAVDADELAETARHLLNGAGQAFQPMARAVVPGLVTWICDVIKPVDDEYEDDAARARQALGSLLATQEG